MPPASQIQNQSVFINCPFDADYLRLFDAIVFTTVACGYTPRSALETGSVSDPRMDRIYAALNGSKYSIHDLSRCRGEGEYNLARFNMPLEFGIAFGKGYQKHKGQRRHDWLVLLPQGHAYKHCMSDIGGYDPREHDGTVPSIVRGVTAWLMTRDVDKATPGPQAIIDAFSGFAEQVHALRVAYGCDYPPWHLWLAAATSLKPTAGAKTPVPGPSRRAADAGRPRHAVADRDRGADGGGRDAARPGATRPAPGRRSGARAPRG